MARRQSRVLALRALFAMDVGGQSHEQAIAHALADEPAAFAGYAREIIEGVLAHREEIDALLGRFSRGWTVVRLASVDRSLLRMATYELMQRPEVAARIVLNEALELAGIYSTEESPRFINGVLAKVSEALGRNFPAEEGDADGDHH